MNQTVCLLSDPSLLYTGGFCNRREDTRSRFSCGGRVNQHYYLFCALFYQWIYRWLWYLSGTALRCERRAWNAKEHCSFNNSQCYICGSVDHIVLCAFPSDHTLDENSGRYCSGGICIYVCRASRYRCDRILQYDLLIMWHRTLVQARGNGFVRVFVPA